VTRLVVGERVLLDHESRGMIFADREEEPHMSRHIESADLPEDIARLAEAQVAAGRFATVEDVVRAGVEALAQIEQKRAAIRAALEEGEQSGIFEGDAFASVRSELGLASR
jgi:antitoxin ParD1/3/4